MKNPFLPFCLWAIILFTGCDKGDDYQPSQRKLLPARITQIINSSTPSAESVLQITHTYAYDSQHRIATLGYESQYNNEVTNKTVHTLSYDGNHITETVTKPEDPGYNETITFKHEGSQIIINGKERIEIDNKFRKSGPVYDSKGNAVKVSGSDYEYDNENGIFRYVNMPSWYLTYHLALMGYNVHNNFNKVTKDGSGHYYVITYNADNYPTEIFRDPISFTLGGSFVKYTIDYIDAE